MCEQSTIKYDITDYGVFDGLSEKVLYQTCQKLSPLIEN